MAAASGVKVGIKCKVYRNTGTYGSPTWTEVTLIRDATMSCPWDLVDASSRAHRVKLFAKTMQDVTVNIVMRADDADAAAIAFYAASQEETVLDLLVLEGPISTEGSSGVRAHFVVNLANQDHGSGSVVYNTYDLKPGYSSEGNPKYVVMGATSTINASDPG